MDPAAAAEQTGEQPNKGGQKGGFGKRQPPQKGERAAPVGNKGKAKGKGDGDGEGKGGRRL
eukprot:1222499-Alexandrium_andersonii.AAC.1